MLRKPTATFRPLVLAALLASAAVSACAPVVLGGAYVGTMAATDRRTVGIQVEDKNIALKISSRLSGRYDDKSHINTTVYNGKVLLTGEVPSDTVKQDAENQVRGVENVRAVVNDLQVGAIPTSLSTRSNDLLIEGKIKASLIEAKDLFANSFRIVVENGVAYLLGRVTEREGQRGTEIAAGVRGVKKVVKVFDYITEAELQGMTQVKAEEQAQEQGQQQPQSGGSSM